MELNELSFHLILHSFCGYRIIRLFKKDLPKFLELSDEHKIHW